MANSTTIKQRFIDILFEPDEEESIDINKNENRKIDKSQIKEASPISAKDLLYGKQEKEPREQKSTTFINLTEDKPVVNKPKEVVAVEEEVYIASPNLSPIFGNIEGNSKKKQKKMTDTNIDYAAVKKPSSNYLGMVLSPIYGYDTVKANDARAKLTEPVKVDYTDMDITEDLTDIFATEEFRVPEEEKRDTEEEINKTDEIDLFSDLYSGED